MVDGAGVRWLWGVHTLHGAQLRRMTDYWGCGMCSCVFAALATGAAVIFILWINDLVVIFCVRLGSVGDAPVTA